MYGIRTACVVRTIEFRSENTLLSVSLRIPPPFRIGIGPVNYGSEFKLFFLTSSIIVRGGIWGNLFVLYIYNIEGSCGFIIQTVLYKLLRIRNKLGGGMEEALGAGVHLPTPTHSVTLLIIPIQSPMLNLGSRRPKPKPKLQLHILLQMTCELNLPNVSRVKLGSDIVVL
jgi:hypothetical protein